MSGAAVLDVQRVSKRFGGVVANEAVSLSVGPGEVHALIGPNGAGKSTLLGQIAGEIRPDSGKILFRNRNVNRWPVHRRAQAGVARSFQITSIFPSFTALENVALAVQAQDGHSFRFWSDAARDERLNQKAERVLNRLGLGTITGRLAGSLSHGDRRRLELAMALAGDPALLLLDEPAAGMGPEETRETMALLAELRGERAILLVEHDMDVVFALADKITVLVQGRVLASGTPDAIRADSAVQAAYLGQGAPAC